MVDISAVAAWFTEVSKITQSGIKVRGDKRCVTVDINQSCILQISLDA
jgi:hypothetical protein